MLSRVVGSCCVRFETGQTFNYLQTDATNPNIIGPTMLGVVAFVLAVVRKQCNNSEQCWELLRPYAFARSFRLFRTERQYFFPGDAWAAAVKQNIKKRKYSKKTASSELKSLFAVCLILYGYILAIRLSHAQISASLDPGQPHPQASSCNPSERRRRSPNKRDK